MFVLRESPEHDETCTSSFLGRAKLEECKQILCGHLTSDNQTIQPRTSIFLENCTEFRNSQRFTRILLTIQAKYQQQTDPKLHKAPMRSMNSQSARNKLPRTWHLKIRSSEADTQSNLRVLHMCFSVSMVLKGASIYKCVYNIYKFTVNIYIYLYTKTQSI